MKIRALSVFERVIYHCHCVVPARPCTPVLELDAIVRDGDADGPLLLPVPEYVLMVGGPAAARRCLDRLATKGRIADHLGVAHVAFPSWTVVDPA